MSPERFQERAQTPPQPQQGKAIREGDMALQGPGVMPYSTLAENIKRPRPVLSTGFDAQVKRLREEGKSYKEVACELNVPEGRVTRSVMRLKRKGQEPIKVNKETRLLDKLKKHQADNPDQGIVLEEIVSEIGANMEYARRLYRKFEKRGENLPPLKYIQRDYIEPRRKRRKNQPEIMPILNSEGILFALLKQHTQEEPDMPMRFTYAEIGGMMGISRERVRQLLDRLYSSEYAAQLPPRPKYNSNYHINSEVLHRDLGILKLIRAGLSPDEIIERLNITKASFILSRKRLLKYGQISAPASTDEINEEIKQEKQQIAKLRNLGLGTAEIAERIGLPIRKVQYRVDQLYKRGEAERLRSRRRSKEELETFYSRVKELRHQGLSYGEIAAKLQVTRSQVNAAVTKLIKKGETEPLDKRRS